MSRNTWLLKKFAAKLEIAKRINVNLCLLYESCLIVLNYWAYLLFITFIK